MPNREFLMERHETEAGLIPEFIEGEEGCIRIDDIMNQNLTESQQYQAVAPWAISTAPSTGNVQPRFHDIHAPQSAYNSSRDKRPWKYSSHTIFEQTIKPQQRPSGTAQHMRNPTDISFNRQSIHDSFSLSSSHYQQQTTSFSQQPPPPPPPPLESPSYLDYGYQSIPSQSEPYSTFSPNSDTSKQTHQNFAPPTLQHPESRNVYCSSESTTTSNQDSSSYFPTCCSCSSFPSSSSQHSHLARETHQIQSPSQLSFIYMDPTSENSAPSQPPLSMSSQQSYKLSYNQHSNPITRSPDVHYCNCGSPDCPFPPSSTFVSSHSHSISHRNSSFMSSNSFVPPPPPHYLISPVHHNHKSLSQVNSFHQTIESLNVPPPPQRRHFQPGHSRNAERPRINQFDGRHHRTSSSFHCYVCDKTFFHPDKYRQHIDEEHIPCDHPGCSYSAPLMILEAHKLGHLTGKNGAILFDDPAETELWVKSRKRNFPSKANIEKKRIEKQRKEELGTSNPSDIATEYGAMEKVLRRRFKSAIGNSSLQRRLTQTSAFIPSIKSILKRQRQWKLRDSCRMQLNKEQNTNKRRKYSSREFTNSELQKPFPICEHFLRYKTCKWPSCHYSHDVAAYRRWQIQRNLRGIDIPMRPPLIYQLLLPEIQKTESLVLQSLRYVIEKNFFRDEIDPEFINEEQNSSRLSLGSKENLNGLIVAIPSDNESDIEEEEVIHDLSDEYSNNNSSNDEERAIIIESSVNKRMKGGNGMIKRGRRHYQHSGHKSIEQSYLRRKYHTNAS